MASKYVECLGVPLELRCSLYIPARHACWGPHIFQAQRTWSHTSEWFCHTSSTSCVRSPSQWWHAHSCSHQKSDRCSQLSPFLCLLLHVSQFTFPSNFFLPCFWLWLSFICANTIICLYSCFPQIPSPVSHPDDVPIMWIRPGIMWLLNPIPSWCPMTHRMSSSSLNWRKRPSRPLELCLSPHFNLCHSLTQNLYFRNSKCHRVSRTPCATSWPRAFA